MVSDTEGQWLVILRDNGYTEGQCVSTEILEWLVNG